MASIATSTGPWSGLPTNASTRAGWVKTARTAAKMALRKMARNGGARRTDRITRRARGARLRSEIWYDSARSAWVSAGSNPVPDAGVTRPMIVNPTMARTTAGPEVQIMAPMCWLVVTFSTIDGTSTVVSEIGVILSPKYAPEMTAPAAMTGLAPTSGARATNATPKVAAVVHELPMDSPTRPQTMAVAG